MWIRRGTENLGSLLRRGTEKGFARRSRRRRLNLGSLLWLHLSQRWMWKNKIDFKPLSGINPKLKGNK